MITTHSILFGILAALISLKVVLLAVAAVLFVYGIREQNRQRLVTPVSTRKYRRLDVRV
jgi:uncharacterized membrane protein